MAAVNVGSIEFCYLSYVPAVLTPSSSYSINVVVVCVVNAIFAVVGTFLNLLVLFTFWKSKNLRNKITYFLIMVLSCTDLGVALIVHPMNLVNFVSEIRGTRNCLYSTVYDLSLAVFAGLSTTNFLTLNIERYLSVVHPIFHRNQVTKPRCVAVLIVLASVYLVSILSRIFVPDIRVLTSVIIFTVCLVTCLLYASIFYTARRVLMPKERGKQQTKSIEERENTAILLRDLKLAKTCLLMVFCCFICYLPAGVVLVIQIAENMSVDILNHVGIWTSTFISINSTLNCLIFFWANRELRKEWKKLRTWNSTPIVVRHFAPA